MSDTKPAEPAPAKKTLYLGPPKRGAQKPVTAASGSSGSPASGNAGDKTTTPFDAAISSYEGKHVPEQMKYSRSFLLGYAKTAGSPDTDTMLAMKTSGLWTDTQELAPVSGNFLFSTPSNNNGFSKSNDQRGYNNNKNPNKRQAFPPNGRENRLPRQNSPNKPGGSGQKGPQHRPVKAKNEDEVYFGHIQSILNKLTLEKFQTLSEKLVGLFKEIEELATMKRAVELIHKKALLEPHFAQMYTDLCKTLSEEAPKFEADGQQATFVKVLRESCQAVFVESLPEVDSVDEETLAKKRKRSLGNIVFMGELFKGKLMAHATVQRCIDALINEISAALPSLDKSQQIVFVTEVNCERLCKLLSTTGKELDQFAKPDMNKNIETLMDFAINKALTARVRFLIRDVIDMRLNDWQPRRKIEGPKTIDEIHADAELNDLDLPPAGPIPVLRSIPTSEFEKRAQQQEDKLKDEKNG